ncbi:methyltransferase domain-containing protein [Rhodopirellula sp. JC740]|uniref:Arsenite methyltransferase n=1 Tax=Rhodopirellula halodulae TaxID=2894198 RepID=A0ABS8NCR3_9BACT|nr:methyltransferase domain-containing protein [Rhodopirellula sp. JC740]
MSSLNVEAAVRERYAQAAQEREAELCCPVDYDAKYLKVIPQEVIDRDYGCGDPSKHVRPGETVLDLGSGGGKICFIASQVVGAEGRVIGVDMNDDMLQLARASQPKVAEAIGYDNVSFRKGKIQDLAIDRDQVQRYLAERPVSDDASLRALEAYLAEQRRESPMIDDESIDVVVSNCVLNLVDADEKELLFDEIFRVLRPGGRAVISDIVCDEEVPEEMQADPELWSGCISGAYQQAAFLQAFESAGFEDIQIAALQLEPWRVVKGIAFRSMTVIATRPEEEPVDGQDLNGAGTFDGCQRVYRGPFKYVCDDAGRMYTRGEVCTDDLAAAASRETIADHFAVYTSDAKATPKSLSLPTTSDCCSGDSCC